MDVFVGIDGGGTRARAVAIDAQGNELARVFGGPGRVRPENPGAVAAALADLTARALRAADARPPAVTLCCALAGAGRAEERMALTAALIRETIAVRVHVITDAEAALYDAFGDGPGMLLIGGTGSIAWGRTADGRTDRTGGWGQRLGDEGSGYALGSAAMRAAVRAHDGRGPRTSLLDAVLAHIGVQAPEQLVAWTATASKGDIAALAPVVVDAAEMGDKVASELVDDAARELALHVAALQTRLAPWQERPILALAGGLLAPGRPMRDRVIEAVQRLDEPPEILDREVDAASGAAAMARTLRPAASAEAQA